MERDEKNEGMPEAFPVFVVVHECKYIGSILIVVSYEVNRFFFILSNATSRRRGVAFDLALTLIRFLTNRVRAETESMYSILSSDPLPRWRRFFRT